MAQGADPGGKAKYPLAVRVSPSFLSRCRGESPPRFLSRRGEGRMHGPHTSTDKSFSAFRTAAEEAVTKREADITRDAEKAWDNEGGHMSSTAGRVMHVSGSDLPYVVSLAHHGCDASEHG